MSYLKIYVRELREGYDATGNVDDLKSTVTERVVKAALAVCSKAVRDLD